MVTPPMPIRTLPPVVVTVAAHDPLGGAGVAADLTTFAAWGVHGTAALTAVTAQRFTSVDRVEPVDAGLLADQLDAISSSVHLDSMKVGLLFDPAQVRVIADRIADGRLPRPVVDPVMVDGRGRRFVTPEVEAACREELFAQAAVLTPNRAEAALLGATPDALAALGAELVVVTGGGADATDTIIAAADEVTELAGEWIETVNVRGSGCTFAAAIAAALAHGRPAGEAVRAAKRFVTERVRDGAQWTLAATGAGPVSHVVAPGGPLDGVQRELS